MELIGLPYMLVVGPKGLEKGVVELKNRATGQGQDISLDEAIAVLSA